jgi:hypothetical protein
MRSILHKLVLPIVLAGCETNPGSRPSPVVPIARQDRCRGLDADLAIIEVVDAPQPFREVPPRFNSDEWWVGVDVTIVVRRVLPATSSSAAFTGPAPSGTFRVHLFTDIDRAVRTGNFTARDASMLTPGRRLLVGFPRHHSTEVDWPFEVIRTDRAAEALAEDWYQFNRGTAASAVFDPDEWNNPARACSMPATGADAAVGD